MIFVNRRKRGLGKRLRTEELLPFHNIDVRMASGRYMGLISLVVK
jgi:hypothetical protein